MSKITVDFSEIIGKMKLMHSVNNGPTGSVRGTNNFSYFTDIIPYARNHDASLYSGYGGEHTVDVHAIFKNFDADEKDPASYDFEMTDRYISGNERCGVKTFYRLGSKIEHHKKYGTFPPKDFCKWARICEHIIRHYTEGWADGFRYDIEYWEIWNEPDCENADGSNPCWQGTEKQFNKFFVTAFKHLKGCFPHLKIGGPAFCWHHNDERGERFFEELKKEDITLDFYSFHCYGNTPVKYYEAGAQAYELLKKFGCEEKTELILNEWNYVKAWLGEEYKYSMRTISSIKGASFVAGSMCEGQRSKLDQLMYYDARPATPWNGMFGPFHEPKKAYYPFVMFSELYKMGNNVSAISDDSDIYCTAATGNGKCGIMVTHFSDDDTAQAKELEIEFKSIGSEKISVEYFLLDEENTMKRVHKMVLCSDELSISLELPLFSTYYIRFTKE